MAEVGQVRVWKMSSSGIRRTELRIRPRSAVCSFAPRETAKKSHFAPLGRCGASDFRPIEIPLAGAALGMAIGGIVFRIAALGTASLLFSSLVFGPSIVSVVRALKKDYRIDNNVLTASRLIVFVLMNFYLVAALDAALRSFSGWMHSRSRERYEGRLQGLRNQCARQLDRSGDSVASSVLADSETMRLAQVPLEKGAGDLRADESADRMSPFMMGAFLFTAPIYGANLASSFLMTSFGAHVRSLSPTLLRELCCQAIDHGVLIRNSDAFRMLPDSPALVVDLNVVHDSQTIAELLKQAEEAGAGERCQFSAVYFLASESVWEEKELFREMAGERRLRGAESDEVQERLNEVLERHGKAVYVSDDIRSSSVCGAQLLTVSVSPLTEIRTADVILSTDLVAGLEFLQAASESYERRVRFNWRTPVVCDLLDISTTLLVHFGVLYSTLFNYSGLVGGILSSKKLIPTRKLPFAKTPSRAPVSATHTSVAEIC